ncbi:hypothetical protein HAX54_015106 [Datura stramonium]|uniref:Uncharacterized protein n=1 Tax=Datura stramonium TaxID=4076 RepID=A0ABS8TQU9_DATST|nr:hypothetical protein [Datura stramonium]
MSSFSSSHQGKKLGSEDFESRPSLAGNFHNSSRVAGYECLAVDKGRSTIAEERVFWKWLTCNVGKSRREKQQGRQRERHRSFGGFCTARIPRSLLQFLPSLALCHNLFLFSFLSLSSLPNPYSPHLPFSIKSSFLFCLSHDLISDSVSTEIL